MITLFNTIFYNPLYNGLVFLIDVVPAADVGLAIILLTIAVRIILLPLFTKTIKVQRQMKRIEPELKEIRKNIADKSEQAKQTLELYKKHEVNPLSVFSSIFIALIQIPVFLALYLIFVRGGLPDIQADLLYSFVWVPEMVNMEFLGLLNVAEKSAIVAFLAGVTQYIQIKCSPLGESKPRPDNPTLKDDFARSFSLQMRYGLPVVVAFVSFFFGAAVALYWTTSNIFAIGQELVVRRRLEKKYQLEDHGTQS